MAASPTGLLLTLLIFISCRSTNAATPQATHTFDFRACSKGSNIEDSISTNLNLIATPVNSPDCDGEGVHLDGLTQYLDLTPYSFGGSTSFEVLVSFTAYNYQSHIFDFGDGQFDDNVYLYNYGSSPEIKWYVRQNTESKGEHEATVNFNELGQFSHVVVTASTSGEMKIYKDGVLQGTKTDGWAPRTLMRNYHWLGRAVGSNSKYFYGTLSYISIYNGVVLSDQDCAELYNERNGATLSPTPSPTTPSPTPSPTTPSPTPSPTTYDELTIDAGGGYVNKWFGPVWAVFMLFVCAGFCSCGYYVVRKEINPTDSGLKRMPTIEKAY
ncbi:hypothetical protein TrVE_jg11490 [Triparma verrucosa]|uniref:Concanavalin A-like lectin/glucanase domain-containing protein n=1 Tax=Triparma verrucosa TaxID=1606542 RepID=A0A9W7F5X2_9STRA|nr:hypothetical protein TrVE_jg11490 [Triparma verrucosa]